MKTLKSILLIMIVAGLFSPLARGAASGVILTNLASFNNTNNGANPYSPPVFGPDGNLYGTLPYGGTYSNGVIFRVTTNGSQSTVHIFTNLDGIYPIGSLISARDGSLYGMASGGGTNKDGTIFKVTTNGAFTLLYSFGMMTNHLGYALDGSSPYAGLVQGRDGNFYGATYSGGTSNDGTVFQFSTNGLLTVLHSFTGSVSNNDGANPYIAPLVEGADGVFYGTTSVGGTNGDGTVFQVTAGGSQTTLFEFNGTNGLNPYAGLSLGSDGNLYGTTSAGGTNGYGTAFRVTTNGTLATFFQFTSNNSYPDGGVFPGVNNVLYGTTYRGGTLSYGTLFQLTTNGQLATLHIFTNGPDGANPFAGVIQDAGGNVYGAALYGGKAGGYGTVYRWNDPTPPTNTITLPTVNQRWSNVVFTATGKATDNVSVANVYYSANGTAWTNASTTNNWISWKAQIALIPGTNVFQSYAMDYSGNLSVTNSVNFDFVVTNQLAIRTVGLGTIKPNYSNAWLEVGRTYSITSAPASGFVFSNWLVSTNWIGGVTFSRTNLQFTMQSNLTLQATFLDVVAPTLTITAPALGQKMTNALATVTGTAADNLRVSNVWYQLNLGPWSLATTTNSYTNWATPLLTLIAGTNAVNAYAMDLAGNVSATKSVSFVSSNTFKLQMNFALAQPLTASGLNFNLQISPGLNGHVQFSTNLANWVVLTNFTGTSTNLNFRDPAATNSDHRFYRAVIP